MKRGAAAAGGIAGLAFVAAQFAAPAWPGFHDWPYATILVLCAVPLAAYVRSARKLDPKVGARLSVSAVGALTIIVTGLASGLLGPDTETLVRAPGVVAPLPAVGAAAFFGQAGPETIARGDGSVVLRRLGAAPVELGPQGHTLVGAAELELRPELAVFVEVRDTRGRHLTVTQPTSASFLSPVLFFPQQVALAGTKLAADAFAVPAEHRQVKAFFVPSGALAAAAQHGLRGDTVLLAVEGEGTRSLPGGIGFAASGTEVELGGLRMRLTLGTYPALVISAVPYLPALWIGGLLVAAGLAFAARP